VSIWQPSGRYALSALPHAIIHLRILAVCSPRVCPSTRASRNSRIQLVTENVRVLDNNLGRSVVVTMATRSSILSGSRGYTWSHQKFDFNARTQLNDALIESQHQFLLLKDSRFERCSVTFRAFLRPCGYTTSGVLHREQVRSFSSALRTSLARLTASERSSKLWDVS